MSKNRASMNISGVMCRCHRQMSGNLSKKRKSSTGRSNRRGLPDAVHPHRASMSLCSWCSAAAACQSAIQAIRRADFERVMAESPAIRKSSAPGVFLLLLEAVFFIKPTELLNSAERGGCFEHHKDRMLMPNGTSNGRRYDCPLSLFNIGFGFLPATPQASRKGTVL